MTTSKAPQRKVNNTSQKKQLRDQTKHSLSQNKNQNYVLSNSPNRSFWNFELYEYNWKKETLKWEHSYFYFFPIIEKQEHSCYNNIA